MGLQTGIIMILLIIILIMVIAFIVINHKDKKRIDQLTKVTQQYGLEIKHINQQIESINNVDIQSMQTKINKFNKSYTNIMDDINTKRQRLQTSFDKLDNNNVLNKRTKRR